MDQALHPRLEASEGSERDNIGYYALHKLAFMILLIHQGPGIRLQPLDAEANPSSFLIQAQNINVNLVANAQHLARMPYPVPGEFGNVHQAISASQVNEDTEIAQTTDGSPSDLTLVDLVHQLLLLLLTPFALRHSFREDQATPVTMYLDDFQR